MKIGPVVSAENILIEVALRVHVVVRRMSSNISGCTGLIFAIISPYRFTCRWWIYTSFSNLSRTLPWQPNNFAVMKVNWYYVHSLQFSRWSTVLFRYYLLGGDTVAPSGLLARLCHAFLDIGFLQCRHWSLSVFCYYMSCFSMITVSVLNFEAGFCHCCCVCSNCWLCKVVTMCVYHHQCSVPGREAECCDVHVCLSVCPLSYLRKHTKFSVHVNL